MPELEKDSDSQPRESKPKPKPKVVSVLIYKDRSGEWRWKGLAGNKNIIAESGEGYRNRPWARRMALEMFPDAKVVWGPK